MLGGGGAARIWRGGGRLTDIPERLGRYRVIRFLGSGGFATVWLVLDEDLETEVAIKVLADNWARNLDVRRRFLEEARIQRRAEDDRIVRVHELSTLDHGRPYFVMDWADRGSLEERIRVRQAGPGFSLLEAANYGWEIAEALTVAERLGVVHRDLKPSNVLLRTTPAHRRQDVRGTVGEEQVMVGDFGLAKGLEAASGLASMLGGTPGYAAPEQLSGARAVDSRADVYSLATIVFELVSGRLPFSGPTSPAPGGPLSLTALRPEVPPSLQAALERGLETDPDLRWASARELGEAVVNAIKPARGTWPVAAVQHVHPAPQPAVPSQPALPGAGQVPTTVAALPDDDEASKAVTAPLDDDELPTEADEAAQVATASPSRRRTLAVVATTALVVLLVSGIVGLAARSANDAPAASTSIGPTTTDPRPGALLYQADFSAAKWQERNDEKAVFSNENGQYRMLVKDLNKQYAAPAAMAFPVGSMRVEVDATHVSGIGGTYGVGCRHRIAPDGTSFYVGAVSPDGFWRISKYGGTGAKPEPLAFSRDPKQYVGFIRQGPNRVALECQGGKEAGQPVEVRLFLNGHLLGEATDAIGLPSGLASLQVSPRDQPLEVRFDNMRVVSL